MFTRVPINIEKVRAEGTDFEVLRTALMAELDTINLYRQMAISTRSNEIKSLLLKLAGEEKAHVGELQHILLRLDPEQAEKMEEGEKEVRNLLYKRKNIKEVKGE